MYRIEFLFGQTRRLDFGGFAKLMIDRPVSPTGSQVSTGQGKTPGIESRSQPNDRKSVQWIDRDPAQQLVQILGPLLVPASEMTSEEIDARWYSPTETRAQKQLARVVAAQILEDEWKISHGYIDLIRRVYASCVSGTEPSRADMESLIKWTKTAHSRRGLERWTVRVVAIIRHERKMDLVDAILEHQMLTGTCTQQMDKLQCISMEESRTARAFAHIMGFVDAMAVHYDDNEHSTKKWDRQPTHGKTFLPGVLQYCQSRKICM